MHDGLADITQGYDISYEFVGDAIASTILSRPSQARLVLHTAAYWLLLPVLDAMPKIQDLAKPAFKMLRLRLLKIAARIIETISRIRAAFATACPDATLFRGPATFLQRGEP